MLALVEPSWESDACAEANHRIANHLSLVVSILRLEKESVVGAARIPQERLCAVLDECGERIESIARIHRLLAQRQPQGPSIELGDYLRETAQSILAGISSAGRNSLRFTSAAQLPMRPEDAVTLGLMVGELVTNAVKYAHPSGVRGSISLDCRRDCDGATVVTVCDDGVGLPEGFDPMTERGSVGFRLLWSLSQRLRAKIEFDSSCLGLRVTLRVPGEK
jgi:two-component sensor histidine kinase